MTARSRNGKHYQDVILPAIRKALHAEEGMALESEIDREGHATVRGIPSYTAELARLGREIWNDAEDVRTAIREKQEAWPE